MGLYGDLWRKAALLVFAEEAPCHFTRAWFLAAAEVSPRAQRD